MNEKEKRELAVEIAMSYLGTWYTWGGDDPGGFDCSGFVIEILKSIGILPRQGDWTAHQLYHDFGWPAAGIITIYEFMGDLVFWESNGKIIHVEMMLNSELSIGASGGGSKTMTIRAAARHNAFIKIRPIKSRPGIAGYLNPYQ